MLISREGKNLIGFLFVYTPTHFHKMLVKRLIIPQSSMNMK